MNKRNRSSPKLSYTELHTLELRVGPLMPLCFLWTKLFCNEKSEKLAKNFNETREILKPISVVHREEDIKPYQVKMLSKYLQWSLENCNWFRSLDCWFCLIFAIYVSNKLLLMYITYNSILLEYLFKMYFKVCSSCFFIANSQ